MKNIFCVFFVCKNGKKIIKNILVTFLFYYFKQKMKTEIKHFLPNFPCDAGRGEAAKTNEIFSIRLKSASCLSPPSTAFRTADQWWGERTKSGKKRKTTLN